MLNLLIKPLLGVAGDMVKGVVETKKAKAEAKLTEIKAATALKEQRKSVVGSISSRSNERLVEGRTQFSSPTFSGRARLRSWMSRIYQKRLYRSARITDVLSASIIYCDFCVIWDQGRRSSR